MKKLFITIGLAAFVASSQAQGTLNFVNAAATLIQTTNSATSTGGPTPATLGGFRYELFFGAAGNSNPALMTGSGVIATNTAVAGRFSAGSGISIPGLPSGSTASIMVRGWSANLGANYASALVNYNLGLGGFLGQSAVAPNFLTGGVPAGGGLAILASPVFGGASGIVAEGASRGFTLVYAPVPEPSSMALAGIGAASLLIFRRRNK